MLEILSHFFYKKIQRNDLQHIRFSYTHFYVISNVLGYMEKMLVMTFSYHIE